MYPLGEVLSKVDLLERLCKINQSINQSNRIKDLDEIHLPICFLKDKENINNNKKMNTDTFFKDQSRHQVCI